MPHPFEHPIDRPYMVGLSRSTGWETLDIKGLAGALEVGHRYLHDVLSGMWRPKTGPAIRERARVVALVGMVLSMTPGEVERRIDTAQALRAEERRIRKLQAGGLGDGRRECTATE